MPLSQPGPYFVGKRQYTLESEGQKLEITFWYPAIKPEGYAGTVASQAAPDTSGAPYPLLLSSTMSGNEFSPHLASHGFVAAGVNGQGPSKVWDRWLVDYPSQIVFMLNQIATRSLDGLEGMIDPEHAGAFGYSFDGYDALALGGARVDPEFYQGQCAQAVWYAVPYLRRKPLCRLVPEEQRAAIGANQFHRAPMDQAEQGREVQFPGDLFVEDADRVELSRSLGKPLLCPSR